MRQLHRLFQKLLQEQSVNFTVYRSEGLTQESFPSHAHCLSGNGHQTNKLLEFLEDETEYSKIILYKDTELLTFADDLLFVVHCSRGSHHIV